MSVRCLGCGTILIQEAVPRTAEVQRAVDQLDARMYMGYGGLAGFVVGFGGWVAFSQDESIVAALMGVCIIAGTAIGKLVAKHQRHDR
jgi:uncharacterized membrane protein